MKKHHFVVMLLTSLIISGCGKLKNENAIYSISTYNDSSIEVTAGDVEYMINNKFSFHLLAYTEQCSYCEKAKDNANKLTDETGFAIYQIEMFEASIDYLSNAFNEYFSANDTYPSLLTFNSGHLTSKSTTNDITNYTSFKRLIDANSYKTNISTLTSKEAYSSFESTHKDYLLYTYSYAYKDIDDMFISRIYSKASQSNKNTLIIDISTANTDLISEICQDYSISDSSIIDLLVIIENGQIKSSLRYSQESVSTIDNLVMSFFDFDAVDSSR